MLTDTAIRRLHLPLKPRKLSDQGGLHLVMMPTGSKLWRWKYRWQGSERLMSFGAYPDVTLLLARERHAAARRLLASGVDPMAQRRTERAQSAAGSPESFETIARLWHAHWRANKSSHHIAATLSRLETNVFPAIGSRPISDVRAPELVRMVRSIESRGAGDIAKRALQTCGQVMRYGIAHGYCERNPVADIKPGDVLRPTVTVNMARVDAQGLPALLRAIEVYRGKPVTRLALRLMALTFVRTGELIGARWAEIDFAGKRWNIPASRMKMKTPHIVPLATQTLEVLELLRSLTGNGDLIFPGDVNTSKPMSNNTILFALKRMGYGGIMTGHGFRGLASTLLHEQGWPHDHIELQLAHAPRNAVSAAYNHALYLVDRARMMQAWGDYLENTQRKLLTDC